MLRIGSCCRSWVDSAAFEDALHLHPTVQAVVECNVAKLCNTGEPIATIKAVHTGPNASKTSSEDASGLEPVICLARGARVMLTSTHGQMLALQTEHWNSPGHLLPEWSST